MRFHRAFSLIELLVVISIIAVLASMLLPAIGMVRRSAQIATCGSNQGQIMMAVLAYAGEHNGYMPNSWAFQPSATMPANAYFFHTERLGQYLDIESIGSGAITAAKGSWKLLRCGANTQAPNAVSYGLNRRFCGDTLSGAGSTVSVPLRRLAKRAPEVVVSTDNAGEGRMYFYNPVILFGNGNLDAIPDWSVGWPYNQPFLPVLRHRGGSVVGYADGHAAWSPNVAVETTAGTATPFLP